MAPLAMGGHEAVPLRKRRRRAAPLPVAGVAALLATAAVTATSSLWGLRGFVVSAELSPMRRPALRPSPLGGGKERGTASSSARHAVITREAPPETGTATSGGQMPWVECVIEECDEKEGECRRMESWVFRKEHVNDYGSFMDIRNFKPSGFLPGRMDYGQTNLRASVSCKERSMDTSLRCAECIRLIKGGPYGARGVAVGAYPQQGEVVPCLKLSKSLPKYEPQPGEKIHSNAEDPRQTAFCNTISAKLL
mmetsp:Transcript_141347/g.368018  ORF Transcript_141347/g.368018 Transcript_141347/m.368018 type:complete len:251 (-) Transcript_141347:322-1074(-)